MRSTILDDFIEDSQDGRILSCEEPEDVVRKIKACQV